MKKLVIIVCVISLFISCKNEQKFKDINYREYSLAEIDNIVDSITKMVLNYNSKKIESDIEHYVMSKEKEQHCFYSNKDSSLTMLMHNLKDVNVTYSEYFYFINKQLLEVRFASNTGFTIHELGSYYYDSNGKLLKSTVIDKTISQPDEIYKAANDELMKYKG